MKLRGAVEERERERTKNSLIFLYARMRQFNSQPDTAHETVHFELFFETRYVGSTTYTRKIKSRLRFTRISLLPCVL